jgi:uncharacterized membrane protein YqiK
MLQTLANYWWAIVPILAIVFYKFILRVLCGMVIIPEDKIGLVVKKFVLFGSNRTLPEGRIVALNGEAGFQVDPLAPGIYWGYWVWQYSINFQSFIEIPIGQIGLIEAKDGATLPMGAMLAQSVECNNYQDGRAFLSNNGQKGKQRRYITAGKYRINTLLFNVTMEDIITIPSDKVGIITALDGAPLASGQIAGEDIGGHNNYQDFDKFVANGGQRGLQIQPILSGSYSLNNWAVRIDIVDMTVVPIGSVGVVISFVGKEGQDISGEDFKHGNIVSEGEKGVWKKVLDPGKYPMNTKTHKIQCIPTTNIVLNWADAKNESHNLDKNLSTITVRSSEGFPFNLDVAQIIHIPSTQAPYVTARFGSVENLVSQVLEPTIGNYFRNSAQKSGVIDFLNSRVDRQNEAKTTISDALKEYNVNAVDTLIGDIVPPVELMKPLTDRKIAQEQEITYESEMKAQKVRQALESETALANMQGQIVTADQSVNIAAKKADAAVKAAEGEAKSVKLAAEAEANKITVTGTAEASKIQAIGKATAEAYEKQVAAMGADNFAKFKIIEEIGKNGTKIIPEILIQGSGDNASPISGLLGFELLNKIEEKHAASAATKASK